MALTKTFKRPKFVSDTVTSAEATAGLKSILIAGVAPSGSATTDDFLYNINIKRSDIDFTSKSKHFYSIYSGTVVVQTNSTDYVLTEDDVITISGTYL